MQTEYHFDPVGGSTLDVIARADRFNQWMYSRIKPFLKGEILEIGSGIGNISQHVVQDGHTITLSDYNPEYQAVLQQRFQSVPHVRGVLTLDLQDKNFATSYPDQLGRYDTVFLLNVIEHLADENLAVANCRMLLKPGGMLIILAPSYGWLYCGFDRELGHYRRYTKRSMARIFPAGAFTLVKQEYFNLAGIAGWFLFGKILKRKQIGKEMGSFNKLVPVFRCLDHICFRRAGLSTITFAQKLA